MFKYRVAAIVSSLLFVFSVVVSGQESGGKPDKEEWVGTPEQRLMGLFSIWAEAKYAFPFPERLKEINWDARVRDYIPRVLEAQDAESYYNVLMEFSALLKDGHTGVNPPWGPFKPGFDAPPIEIQVIEDKFIIARTGETDELMRENIYPGLEIVSVDDDIPIRDYFQKTVLLYNSRGTKQADDAINIFWLFQGAKGSKLVLKVKDADRTMRTVSLTRDSTDRNGQRFTYRIFEWDANEQILESTMLPGGILYVKLFNFENEGTGPKFQNLIDSLDGKSVKGMIIDLRYNPGGYSNYAADVISCLVDHPVQSEVSKIPHYVAAYRAWKQEPVWTDSSGQIEPRKGNRYSGPLVLLIGPATYSSAEDFIVPLHAAKRAILVGERTAGSTGNPLRVPLPGGGNFRVVTLKAVYPDGREFVGIGIPPDVAVKLTEEDICEGRDPVLQKGIEIVTSLDRLFPFVFRSLVLK